MSSFPGWREALSRVVGGVDLSHEAAADALGEILDGNATPAQIAAFLVALRMKGESVGEITGFVSSMMAHAAPLVLPENAIDIVGTGGSTALRAGAFNVSTVAAIVAAAGGATVCKHGNRLAPSTSGSFDLLERLGVAIDLDGVGVRRCVDEAGIGFCFARVFHPAMRHVGPVRAEIGVPTVFNILGPLSHPGDVRRQVLGVADAARVDLIASVLAERGLDRAVVVRGEDGLDEFTLTGPSSVVRIEAGVIEHQTFDPASVGLARRSLDELIVGDPEANAVVARRVLRGEPGAHRDLVVLNAGVALEVAGVADDIADGVRRAADAIDGGAAAATLDRLVEVSNAASRSA